MLFKNDVRLKHRMLQFLQTTGEYFLFLKGVFSKPQKFAWFRKQLFYEMNSLGINSLPIITIISLFMGAVITIQTAYNIDSPFIPLYAVGLATRDSIILEFSPTIISLILAGKVGSSISSEIGTMRVTEQIDALEIMGINSASYLALPKIVAAVIINPFLIIISMFQGIIGGWFFGSLAGVVTSTGFVYGVQYAFQPFYVTYAIVKTVFFAFLITSISSFFGYYTSGGALEVGASSTKAVVYSSIFLLVMNYLLTQLLLS
jgi:phospholipid/cholesterol/gamma-HCH transport system permease protein